ncbi:hypothetical protein [Mycobacterium sp. OTB74]|uniref:hypothetical protein n=1 Tax=Mycobacterium sp. OTB74 TaxID=1853452 RepID=UPI002473CD87|nr:hypothetical protein [Mycobacterium sp. OTB74]MDH6245542.1 uncharacterized protein YbjT (DUF2867 family) [Mycobacterium sp. OTB74]
MDITVLGAAGRTGVWICREALRAGHRVRTVSRRTDPIALPATAALTQVCADALHGVGRGKRLAAAMVAELDENTAHLHQAVAPTTQR